MTRTKVRPAGVRVGVVRLWDAEGGRVLNTFTVRNAAHAAHVFAAAFSPDGKTVALATADFRILLFDVQRLRRPKVKKDR